MRSAGDLVGRQAELAGLAGLLGGLGGIAMVVRLLRLVNSLWRTMIIIDDMQWLDAESARALSALCRQLQVPDVDVLIAIRGRSAPEELGIRTREYLLAPADAQELLGRGAATLHGDARDAVLRQAAGNPLALVELGQAVAASPPGRLGPSTTARCR